ncbi:MAG: hypothetical protein ABIQ78_11080 [Dokdonella sp.]
MGISQNALARAAGVPPRRLKEIALGKQGVGGRAMRCFLIKSACKARQPSPWFGSY